MRRNVKGESGALSGLRSNTDFAAVKFNHFAADEEAEARASISGVGSDRCLLEPLEDAQLLVAAESTARVGDLEV